MKNRRKTDFSSEFYLILFCFAIQSSLFFTCPLNGIAAEVANIQIQRPEQKPFYKRWLASIETWNRERILARAARIHEIKTKDGKSFQVKGDELGTGSEGTVWRLAHDTTKRLKVFNFSREKASQGEGLIDLSIIGKPPAGYVRDWANGMIEIRN